MATKTKEQLKAYFRKGMFPTESQFADLIDSLRHIGEKLRIADVQGLADALNSKENRSEMLLLRNEFDKVCEEVRKNESTFRLALEAMGYSEDMLVEILGIVEKYASLKQDVVNAAGNIMELQRTCKTLPRFSGIVVDLPSGTAVYNSGTSSPSTGAGCAVVFDKSCNRFLLRRAPAGSHPTYYTLWVDAESMGLTRDPDPLLPRVFRASEGVAYMATEPPYGLYFLSEQGAVPVPGSLLLPAIEAKVDKEEGKGLSSNDFTDEDKSTLDNLRCLPCYVPDTGTRLGEEQKAVNKLTFDSINASLKDDCCHVINIINPNSMPGIPVRIRSFGYVLIHDNSSALIYYAVQGSFGTYARVKLNSDGSLSDHKLSGITVPVESVKENHVLTGNSAGKIISSTLKTLNGQSLLGEGDITAVAPEEGKGLSNIVAGDPQTSDNLPSIYTCSREQLKMDLFIDLFDTAAGPYGGYDPVNAPDPGRPFMLNGLWFSYAGAVEIYNWSVKGVANSLDSPYQACRLSTVLPLRITSHIVDLKRAFRSCSLRRVSIVGPNYDNTISLSNAADFFADCQVLEEVVCETHSLVLYNISSATFRNCRALREIRLRVNDGSFDIHWSPLLSSASVRSFIPASAFQKEAVITVHPDVYAKLTGDTSNAAAAELTQEELEEWQQILLDATEKNITFATV